MEYGQTDDSRVLADVNILCQSLAVNGIRWDFYFPLTQLPPPVRFLCAFYRLGVVLLDTSRVYDLDLVYEKRTCGD